MTAIHVALTCPGCGAPLSVMVEPPEQPEHGVLLCEHGHVYDVDNPDDDRELQSRLGPGYRNSLHA